MTRRLDEPPRFAAWLLSHSVSSDDLGSSIVGDLHEEWSEWRATAGTGVADHQYRREALLLAVAAIRIRMMHWVRRPARTIDHRTLMQHVEAVAYALRYALRSLRRSWQFAAGVVLSIGLAVGLGVPALGLADHFFLRAPPGIAEPDRVMRLVLRGQGRNGPYFTDGLTGLDYGAMTTQSRALENVAGWINLTLSLGRGADARSITTTLASASFFRVLGVRPVLGRFYDDAEDVEGSAEAPCVVSYRFWHTAMSADRAAVGKRFVIGSVLYTVIGVAPEGFNGVGFDAVDAWLPVHVAAPEFQGHDAQLWTTDHSAWLRIVARIRRGVSLAAATTDAARVYRTAGLRTRDPDLKGTMLWDPLQPGRSSLPNTAAHIALWLSAGGVLLVVLVTMNLLSLFIARTAAQRQQLAIRLAVGGGWADLLRLHILEN